jgi:hypothetical protein
MITIKAYAKSRHISYEAVRQSIKRHKDELSDHIVKQGKTQYLTDGAVEILDRYRLKGKVSVYDRQDTDDTNDTETVDLLKNQIIVLQQKIIELQSESARGIEARVKLEQIESDIDKLTDENKQLRSEVSSYHRTIFGLYKKTKS